MAVPKQKKSRSRTRRRRSQHDKLTPTNFIMCPRCGEPKRSHRVCLHCGYYKDSSVIPVID